ncbi:MULTISPECIES: prepilin peptidase [Gemella]|uniref:prepilin peptidase n=1 Tax=Gemella TaxID=1378 RepID=UPI000767EE8A|nr:MULTISPECIES: A24 family peptidase [Gemella]AME09078.1 peptidase A24 [Gemella sp. oral taxon 928]AXI26649.1 prepilin peptidase [Gemella sp. ND 6198]
MEKGVLLCFYVVIMSVFASGIKCFIDSSNKRSFLYRRSCCDSCKHLLGLSDLIPIVSFIISKGRCRYCHTHIPIDIFMYEVVASTLTLLYFIFQEQFIFLSIFHLVIAVLLSFISIEDVKHFEVVDELFFPLLFCSIIFAIYNFKFFSFYNFFGLIVLFHILYFLTRFKMGYGDIKIFCILALSLNFYEGLYLLIFTFLYAGGFAVGLLILNKVKKGSKIALVPFITLSYLTIILIREAILW